MADQGNLMDKIVSLCKRRGFVYPGSEIYGGLQGFYDFGPLGVELLNNLKREWWKENVWQNEQVYGLDGAIITHPRVWEASGHIKHFNEKLVECKVCHQRFSLDKLSEKKCPECGGELTEPKKFSNLVEVLLGTVEGEKKITYLRGEACQTIYLNYQNILNSFSPKIPFGIAQIGKAFRNEITLKSFIFRTREFEQWDVQWFVNPKEMEKWYEYWKEKRMAWYKSLLNNHKNIRFRQHAADELAHYSKVAFDIEYHTPFGWQEWEGIHWRGDWDLSRHGEFANKDFIYTDPVTGEKFLPWIVETSGGVNRTFLYVLMDAYDEEKDDKGSRVVLRLKPCLAPYKAAVFPLLANKSELVEAARKVYEDLQKHFVVTWDDHGNIGKRYRRQDEIGTPWCLTVDFDTLKDHSLTVRERDSMKQERVGIDKLKEYLAQGLETV